MNLPAPSDIDTILKMKYKLLSSCCVRVKAQGNIEYWQPTVCFTVFVQLIDFSTFCAVTMVTLEASAVFVLTRAVARRIQIYISH